MSVLFFIISVSFANLAQLTSRDFRGDQAEVFRPNQLFTHQTFTRFDQTACTNLDQAREDYTDYIGTDLYREIFEQLLSPLIEKCFVKTFISEDKIVAIQMINHKRNHINPQAHHYQSSRQYLWNFEGRSRRNLQLQILDDVSITDRVSNDFMESTLVFIPRRYIPSIDINHPVKDERKILLPTGEAVIFDTITKTITGGVLKESPIDMNLNPDSRSFARVSYTGQAIVIRVNRRAGIPEYTYSTASNTNEDPENAIILYKNLSCTVHKSLIWSNTAERSKPAVFKYSTDQKFLDEVINSLCGWGLTLEDITPKSNNKN